MRSHLGRKSRASGEKSLGRASNRSVHHNATIVKRTPQWARTQLYSCACVYEQIFEKEKVLGWLVRSAVRSTGGQLRKGQESCTRGASREREVVETAIPRFQWFVHTRPRCKLPQSSDSIYSPAWTASHGKRKTELLETRSSNCVPAGISTCSVSPCGDSSTLVSLASAHIFAVQLPSIANP